jgi:predicted MFS family arabinose efflux permease
MQNQARRALWHNRDYLVLWSGQLISVVGSRISGIGLPLLVLRLTGSPAQAGTVAALSGLPYLLFGLLAGVLVDRWGRKRTMLVCEAINGIAMTTIPLALWAGHLSMPQLYVVALVTGTAFVFFNVAEIAALPSVVSAEQLPAAVGQNQAAFSVGGMVGPPVAGLLFQLGRALPFLADALSYAVSFVSLLAVRVPFAGEQTGSRRSLRAELWEGMTWLWSHPSIRALTLLTACSNLLTGGFVLFVILLAQRQHASPAVIGGIFAVASGAAVVGAMLAPRVLQRVSVGRIAVWFFWVSAALYPLYLLAPNAVSIALINGAAFLAGPTYNIATITYRLRSVPDALQGRVNSAARALSLGANPVGAAVAGVVLQVGGVDVMVWVLAVGTGLLALAATVTPSIRRAPLVVAVRSA